MPNPPVSRQFISDLITPGTIEPALIGRRREDVLAELVTKVPGIAHAPDARQTLLRALLEREQLFSTGIGDGVALPHARHALAGLVEKPVVVFGRHRDGIDYGSIDAQPARLFFLIVSTNVAEHLQILAHVGRLVRSRSFRSALLAANDAEAILNVIREAEGGASSR